MRFLPHTENDRVAMLESMGMDAMSDLFTDIPDDFHLEQGRLNLPEALSEAAIVR